MLMNLHSRQLAALGRPPIWARRCTAGLAIAATVSALAVLAAPAGAVTLPARPNCVGTSYQWTGDADGSSWTKAGNWQPNGVPGTCGGDSVVIGVEANIDDMPQTTLADLTVQPSAGSDGSLAGGPLTVTGQFEWDGGGLAASVTLPVGASGSIGGPANSKGVGDPGLGLPGKIDVFGALTLDDLSGTGGSLSLGGAGSQGLITVEAGATLTSTGSDDVNANCCGTTNGTLVNSGTVDVTDGQLTLAGAELQQSGAVQVAGGALLDMNAPLVFGAGSSYGGSGEMLLDLNARPATLAGNISLGSGFQLDLGPQACMDGSATISGAGSFLFTGGNLAAAVTIAKGTTMHVTGPGGKSLSTFACGSSQGQIINDGTIIDDQGSFSFGTTGTLDE